MKRSDQEAGGMRMRHREAKGKVSGSAWSVVSNSIEMRMQNMEVEVKGVNSKSHLSGIMEAETR